MSIEFLSALWIYDYFLTLPLEICVVWSRKKNVLTVIFALSRYGFLGAIIVNLAIGYSTSLSDRMCAISQEIATSR